MQILLKDSLSDVTLQECLSLHHSLFVVPCQLFDVQNYLKVHPEFFGQKNLAGSTVPMFPFSTVSIVKKEYFCCYKIREFIVRYKLVIPWKKCGILALVHCKNCGVLCPPNEQHTIGGISHQPLKVCLAHLIWCARS